MRNHFRAGLVDFVLAFALLLVTTSAAPILSKQVSATALLQPAAPHYLVQQPPFDVAHRNSETLQQTLESRDGMAAREFVILTRRTSLGTKIKDGLKKVFHKIGEGLKTAVQKVGHFVKTTGAKIAKVGLKVWSVATKALSKVAQFIPVIGKPLSKAMDAASTVENKVSDSIHVKLGKKLDTAMHRMDKGQKVMGYIPRDLAESVEACDFAELDEQGLHAINTVLGSYTASGVRGRNWDEVEDLYMY